jgi:hypothetical protein
MAQAVGGFGIKVEQDADVLSSQTQVSVWPGTVVSGPASS